MTGMPVEKNGWDEIRAAACLFCFYMIKFICKVC